MPVQTFSSVAVTESFGWFFIGAIVALWVLCPLAYVMVARWARDEQARLHDEAWAAYESDRLSWPKRIGIMALVVALFLLAPASVYSSIAYQPPDPCTASNGWFWYLLYGCYLG